MDISTIESMAPSIETDCRGIDTDGMDTVRIKCSQDFCGTWSYIKGGWVPAITNCIKR